ncbi:hypothetical protein H734_09872 [Pseudomonas aeruginosa PA45]|nr:hypothetical protein H734_09872 [Pseudomonas aeruginosa PA45]
MRQNVALGLDIFAAGVFEYRRVIWLSGMIRHEGIPGFDRLAIQQNSQSRPGAFQVSVKHHSQVLFDFVDQIEKVLHCSPWRDDAIQLFPENQGARCAGEAFQKSFRTGMGALQQMPAVVGTAGQEVEIPAEGL